MAFSSICCMASIVIVLPLRVIVPSFFMLNDDWPQVIVTSSPTSMLSVFPTCRFSSSPTSVERFLPIFTSRLSPTVSFWSFPTSVEQLLPIFAVRSAPTVLERFLPKLSV